MPVIMPFLDFFWNNWPVMVGSLGFAILLAGGILIFSQNKKSRSIGVALCIVSMILILGTLLSRFFILYNIPRNKYQVIQPLLKEYKRIVKTSNHDELVGARQAYVRVVDRSSDPHHIADALRVFQEHGDEQGIKSITPTVQKFLGKNSLTQSLLQGTRRNTTLNKNRKPHH